MTITLHLLIQALGRNALKTGEIGIQHHLPAANRENSVLDRFRGDNGL